MRAPEALYFKADGTTLVRETDSAARKLYCQKGDMISAADLVTYRDYFVTFGWLKLVTIEDATPKFASIVIEHDDASESKSIDLPPRSMIQDVLVVCTEDSADAEFDFGELGGDSDGILDGIGVPGVCDTTESQMDASANFKGRGALIAGLDEDDKRIKLRKYFPNGATLTNTLVNSGTAGKWAVHVMYIVLPEVDIS